MTHQARAFNATVNLHRKNRSHVPLPAARARGERHEHAAHARRHEDAPVIVIAHNPVPELESPRRASDREQLRPPLAFDHGRSLGWFEHEDGGYFILWYELNEKFVEFHPAERQLLTIRIEGPDDRVALPLIRG